MSFQPFLAVKDLSDACSVRRFAVLQHATCRVPRRHTTRLQKPRKTTTFPFTLPSSPMASRIKPHENITAHGHFCVNSGRGKSRGQNPENRQRPRRAFQTERRQHRSPLHSRGKSTRIGRTRCRAAGGSLFREAQRRWRKAGRQQRQRSWRQRRTASTPRGGETVDRTTEREPQNKHTSVGGGRGARVSS